MFEDIHHYQSGCVITFSFAISIKRADTITRERVVRIEPLKTQREREDMDLCEFSFLFLCSVFSFMLGSELLVKPWSRKSEKQ